MEVFDYYCPTSLTNTISYGLGQGAGTVTVATVEAISPLKAGALVAGAWGAIAAIINLKKYKKGVLTGKDAVLDTAGESAGMGLAAGIGLLASNAIRASAITLASSTVVPFTIGVVVTGTTKVLWDCHVQRNLKCEVRSTSSPQETICNIMKDTEPV